jgi:mRNA deadenylase 3'-5' endonuclease subunit Ccr4
VTKFHFFKQPIRHRLGLRSGMPVMLSATLDSDDCRTYSFAPNAVVGTAYASVCGSEPEFTSFTHAGTATTDYIYYTACSLSLSLSLCVSFCSLEFELVVMDFLFVFSLASLNAIGCLRVANKSDIERDTALPSASSASDHQMLMTVFESNEKTA